MKHNLLTQSAALAFYTALSLAPLLLITLAFLGIIGRGTQDKLVTQIENVVGTNAALAINVVIESAQDRTDLSGIGGIIGTVVLFFTASSVFAQLQTSLNIIWETELKNGVGIKDWLKKRLISMGMVLSLGFISIVSLIVTTALNFVFNNESTIWILLNQLVSLAVFTTLFAAIYKILPDLNMRWREAFIGASLTAVLFIVGKELIGLYLGQSAVASAYGAMGSLMVFLIWVYYSSLILFMGAELTSIITKINTSEPIGAHESL